MLTDCSSIQGSTASSSSDVMTPTSTSSWCAIAVPGSASTRLRVLRLIRPHSRRILVAPDTNPSFGFAVRGGKEFGIGFFVSNVERHSEAELKGMRIGDQILRINGFRVDDAVHKELVQFITSQDRITLKVRSVGMLPTKDKDSDQLSWHVIKATSVSSTPSEHSFKTGTIEREMRSKDINIVLNVAPRTKLGLGICKGPEWKPGIFVQFTKEKSPARESGLRPGDQILSVNSIDFSDVLFSEAVAVMKGSNKLEMLVRTAAGCDLFPGESSGYNSSASSVTGDQSPCWADAKSKRLTAVREEPIAACWNEQLYAEQRRNVQPSEQLEDVAMEASVSAKPQVNKTIIKLSENGTSINNTYIASPSPSSARSAPTAGRRSGSGSVGGAGADAIAPPPPPPTNLDFDAFCASRQSGTKTVIVEVHRNGLEELKRQQQQDIMQRRVASAPDNNTCNHIAKSAMSSPSRTPKAPEFEKCQRSTSGNNNSHSYNNHINNVGNIDSSTLSSAITEELKKRKEKQRINAAAANNNGNCSDNNNHKQHNYMHSRHEQQHQQQQQQQQMTATNATARQQVSLRQASSLSSLSGRPTSNTANCSERNNSSAAGSGFGVGVGVGVGSGVVDQHNALMDEFKRAHQRMFKNGFHESERKERQDVLRNTAIMEDEVNHRASRNFAAAATSNGHQRAEAAAAAANRSENAQSGQQLQMPPPPPQFANSPPKSNPVTNTYKMAQSATSTSAQRPPTAGATADSRPPSSPVPDYDNVEVRAHAARPASGYTSLNIATNSRDSANTTSNRRTMRLGTVTIGEYDQQQRKEPAKFDFIAAQKCGNSNNNSANNGNNANNNEAHNANSLHAELQSTLTRSKLKKISNEPLEHQSNCPLRNSFENSYENVTRKLQGTSLTGKAKVPANGAPAAATAATAAAPLRNGNSSNGAGPGTSTNGILKNGNRNSGGNFSKNSDKTITFGN